LEQAVKQRLVGAVVLTALAVITLPMIFDTERPQGVQVEEVMPPAPEFPAVATPEPQPVALPPDRPAGDPVPVAEMYQMAGDPPADTADKTAEPVVAAVAPPAQPAASPSLACSATTIACCAGRQTGYNRYARILGSSGGRYV
jgi:DedD protein